MSLASQWETLEADLDAAWGEVRVRLTVEMAAEIDRVAALLGPAQPFRGSSDSVSFRVTRDGSGPSTESVRRLLARLDSERLHGTLIVASSQAAPVAAATTPTATLPASWEAALATLPGDWSDLLGEVELDSSDYFERAALHLGPINPRKVGEGSVLQFRSASRFGYGASAGMVKRCFERCDADGIRGSVRVLRVLSDTRPVSTQGPTWLIDGRTV
jgi:hypothetical protein